MPLILILLYFGESGIIQLSPLEFNESKQETVGREIFKGGGILMRLIFICLVLISIYLVLKPKFTAYEDLPLAKLDGISWKEDGAIAIINGEVLREGDTIGEYEIKKIEKSSVILVYKDQELKLTFSGLINMYNIKEMIKNWLGDTIEKWFKEEEKEEAKLHLSR